MSGLCMHDDVKPVSAETRLTLADKIISRAAQTRIAPDGVIIDRLAMAMSDDSQAGRFILDTIQLVVRESGVNIIVGASNVSFGLPDRNALDYSILQTQQEIKREEILWNSHQSEYNWSH